MTMTLATCFTCKSAPAWHGTYYRSSAYCADCQPAPRPPQPGYQCAACGTDFSGLKAFDAHLPCGTPHLQTRRRTARVTMANITTGHEDILVLCDAPGLRCLTEFLSDLGIHHDRNGTARAHVGWSGRDYIVTWTRKISNGAACAACEPYWRTVAEPPRRPVAPPTAGQLAARAKFTEMRTQKSLLSGRGPAQGGGGGETPPDGPSTPPGP